MNLHQEPKHAIFWDFDMDVVPETLFEEILTSVPNDEATISQFLCYISYLLKVCEKVVH